MSGSPNLLSQPDSVLLTVDTRTIQFLPAIIIISDDVFCLVALR